MGRLVITKHGRPVAQLCPVPVIADSQFGYMRHTLRVTGDALAPIDVRWSALAGDEDHLYGRPARGRRRKR